MGCAYRRLVVILIRTSKYDDEGYVIRHWRGTLPSNTLACLSSLTEDVVRSGVLGDIDVRVEMFDEIVSRVRPRSLGRRFHRPGTKVVVGLVGVQTNQFPRAQDLARQFKAEGVDVIIGGFHVSGSIAMSAVVPPECQEMLDAGVTLVAGEVEGRWGDILADVVHDRLRPVYNFLDAPPDLADMPLPRLSFRTQKRFVESSSGTIDAGRGCPFACSFCTVINVQGRRMRARSAEAVLGQIRRNYTLKGRRGVRNYFFTDDNFSRNPHWEEIFDGLIRLRAEENLHVDFCMQVDTQAAKIPGFVDKAARAGCATVFIGIESVRDDNLKAGGKPQNRAAEYRDMIARWHEVGVVCHAGIIIGFPYDTYERVMEDIRSLTHTIRVDLASFFMLMPIPGSRDHDVARQAGVALDGDYNNYDSFHPTTPHPRMSREEWERAFQDSWGAFYSREHMRRTLLAQNPKTYWGVLKHFVWYRAAMIEGAPPMITGFFRLKDRTSRRPTFPIERRWPFFKRRVRESSHLLLGYLRLCFEMEELWMQTRIRRNDYWFLGDLRRLGPQSVHALKLTWGRVHASVGARLATVHGRVGDGADAISETLAERLEAVRGALGSRAAALRTAIADHAGAARGANACQQRRGGPDTPDGVQQALSDLHVAGLPKAPPPSSLRARLKRANPFSLEHVDYDPALAAYWRRTRDTVARLRLWRLNPVRFAWNLARGTRHTLFFLFAMQRERY